MSIDSGGDRAVGLSMDSHTNAVTSYVPAEVGVHDADGLND